MRRARIRELALLRHRYGYRRLHIMLRWEGLDVGRALVYRLFCKEGLAAAKEKIATWSRDYNESRPHRALNNLTPLQYVAQMENGA